MKSKQSLLLKVIFHLSFWIGLVAMLNSEIFDLEWGPWAKREGTLFLPLASGMAINAILFYLNTFLLIPKYLHKKRITAFWRNTVLVILGLTLFEFAFDLWHLSVSGGLDPASEDQPGWAMFLELLIFFSLTLFVNTFFWAMAFLYRWPLDWVRNERQKQQLISDKLSAELDFLKAQINPHFLFNGINSIYHLIGDDPARAQKLLLKFSDLLRYQLYECKEDAIPLTKELNYIKNYLGIEVVRKGEDATIAIELPETSDIENGDGLKIAPLLITPFLENAFKYLSLNSEKEKNILTVDLSLEGNGLHLLVRNTFNKFHSDTKHSKSSGIGLKNVTRRLALLYPGKHQLTVSADDQFFTADLKIQLI